jgi:predicted DNA-binding helix-hairpin-helix protein
VNSLKKLEVLAKTGDVDSFSCISSPQEIRKQSHIVLTQVVKGGGKKAVLLKSLLTSVCEHNCLYCPFRAGRDFPRTSFSPEEFARLAVNLSRAGLIQGIFLSSGVTGGGVRTQDRLLETAEILRKKHGYRDYLHLKIMPGAEFDQVVQAMRLADRISINLEAPNAEKLPLLAPEKDFENELLLPLKWAHQIRQTISAKKAWKNSWPASCTQFVVGGSGETDEELLKCAQNLHSLYELRRVYFSAFQPHRNTPLENHPATTYQREQRLYQADYLIRDYGFTQEELIYDADKNLTKSEDPKLAWAEVHLKHNPVEINTANRNTLLRVPGIGPVGADAILRLRRRESIRDIRILRKAGLDIRRLQDYVLTNGRKPASQPSLF